MCSKKNELISEKSELLDVEKRDSKMVNIDDQITFINSQLSLLLQDAERADNIPRTVEHNEVKWVNTGFDWTEGFFPGTCWYLYEATKDKKWKKIAKVSKRPSKDILKVILIKTKHLMLVI